MHFTNWYSFHGLNTTNILRHYTGLPQRNFGSVILVKQSFLQLVPIAATK